MLQIQRKRAYARNVSPSKKTLIGILAILLLVSSISAIHTHYTTNSEKILEIKEIYISPGLIGWALYKKYAPNTVSWDEFVWQVEQINGCNLGDLKAGQKLLIPIYKGE